MKSESIKGKKILHVLYSSTFSGAENVACTIVENFNDEYDMAYCCPHGYIDEVLKNKKIKQITITKLSIQELNRVIDEFQPDIVHAHDFKASCLMVFTKFKGVIISHIHQIPNWFNKLNWKTILYHFCTKRFQHIIFVSNSVYDGYKFKNKILHKYCVIYNYVDEKRIEKLALEKYSNIYDVCFFGRLVSDKNPQQFIEIVRSYKEKYNCDIKTCMIGNGFLENECQELIQKYHLEKNIELLGFQNNPYKIVKNCKVILMPSLCEGLGLTAIESLLLDKIVLNSGVGGLSEIFKDTDYICNSIEEYVFKINEILNGNLELNKNTKMNLIQDYTDYSLWKSKIKKIYES